MKAKANKDFYSLSLGKKFKAGDELDEKKELIDAWVKDGCVSVKESKPAAKRKTKELKSKKSTK